MKQLLDGIIDIKNIINIFVEFDYLLILLMFFSFFDMYFSISYGISFLVALEDWNKYLVNPKDYICSLIILSFVFSIIFPSVRGFYRVFAIILLEINVDLFERDDYRNISISELKNKAILENNSIMYGFCVEKERERRGQYIAYSAFWGVITFMFIQYMISGISPLLLTLFSRVFIYLDSGNWFFNLLLSILVLAIAVPLLVFLGSSFIIRDNKIYLPIDKKK